MPPYKPGNLGYALDTAASMADSESDLETDGLELALETLCSRHCSDQSSPKSKEYCSEFCQLVEEYTGQWHVPLPQLKVLRTALCSFTKATAAFPDDCQHIHQVLSSLALSFFELLLFFSKEEFVEEPLKNIIYSFQQCHSELLRHRNGYLQQVKHIIKSGGPWENPVLQRILKEADLQSKDVEEYLSSEQPIFLELRVRYLQACERLQEAMALSKSCLENPEAGKHLFFHQAYLTCLYKASLHEHLHKEMAEIDGRDAVEIICNTERVEKDEVLLSLCKAFLTQYLQNGDMYYMWDLLFIWSRLHLRAHPSREGFLAECLSLASSSTNVRAIFPFIKLVTTEVGGDGIEVCLELCARALHLCDIQSDSVTCSLVCKTIAFLLPHDLEICRACALLVFCQERSLETYRTVCLLFMHPDQEPHPHNSPVRTNVRFHVLQMLKERLCFDPEFWNLLTLRTYCLELINDNVLKATVLNEMKEEEKEYSELSTDRLNESCCHDVGFPPRSEATFVNQDPLKEQNDGRRFSSPNIVLMRKRKKWRRRRIQRGKHSMSDDEADPGDDPEIKFSLKSTLSVSKPMYSLRPSQMNMDISAPAKFPLNRKREYLSRCVKSQILKRKGRKKRWLQGLQRPEQVQTLKESMWRILGKRCGRKPMFRLEFSYPDNEIFLPEDECGFEEKNVAEDKELDMPHLDNELQFEPTRDLQNENGLNKPTDLVCVNSYNELNKEEFQRWHSEGPPTLTQVSAPAVEGDPELDGPPLVLLECPVEFLHCYCMNTTQPDGDDQHLPRSSAPHELNGDADEEHQCPVDTELSHTEQNTKRTWRERQLRTRQFAHMIHHCSICRKDYKGLNIMRHAISHLKTRRLKCILCGKRFNQLSIAKKHILDHFDEMCKQPPPEKPPVVNGAADAVKNEEQPQAETETPISDEKIPRKTVSRSKVSSLNREERIIRNIRTLIKKTAVLHQKRKNCELNSFKCVEFQDEQVVIKDDLAIIKGVSVTEKNEGEQGGEERPAGENGYGSDATFHLCPSETCDRVFLRSNNTLFKHALKSHANEEIVLAKTFDWAKKKCTLCLRQLQFLEQYKEHMKLHNNPLPNFCYHIDCDKRFVTQQEVKDHIVTHKPFSPRCTFPGCEKLFSNIQCLYDHEWRHFTPAPQREELEQTGARRVEQSAEAPWKQRVKVEELWMQLKKEQWESQTPCHGADSEVVEFVEMQDESIMLTEEIVCDEPSDISQPTVNGCELEETVLEQRTLSPTPHAGSSATLLPETVRQKDPLNVKEPKEVSTLSEGIQQKLGEPHINEHKSFRPEDPAYATFVKTPFTRLPPSAYLDESVLSMRKRRSEVAPRKHISWKVMKKEEQLELRQAARVNANPDSKIRHRCGKCLSSFSSAEELKKHQELNTCSSLFGFDSDDES